MVFAASIAATTSGGAPAGGTASPLRSSLARSPGTGGGGAGTTGSSVTSVPGSPVPTPPEPAAFAVAGSTKSMAAAHSTKEARRRVQVEVDTWGSVSFFGLRG